MGPWLRFLRTEFSAAVPRVQAPGEVRQIGQGAVFALLKEKKKLTPPPPPTRKAIFSVNAKGQ